jgi:hypothetical protein
MTRRDKPPFGSSAASEDRDREWGALFLSGRIMTGGYADPQNSVAVIVMRTGYQCETCLISE